MDPPLNFRNIRPYHDDEVVRIWNPIIENHIRCTKLDEECGKGNYRAMYIVREYPNMIKNNDDYLQKQYEQSIKELSQQVKYCVGYKNIIVSKTVVS